MEQYPSHAHGAPLMPSTRLGFVLWYQIALQAALDEMMKKQKKTTITIAHRLSTIRSADKIAIVNKGRIAEEGNHEALLAKKGIYFGLVQAQSGH